MHYEHLKIFYLISLIANNQAAVIMQNPKLTNVNDGFLELRPNGTLILRSTLNNSSSLWQEALIFKTILNAIRLVPMPATKFTLSDLNKKMYGEGVEHKFPPFLERVIQRIQTYFSVYRYTDTSEPMLEIKKPTSTATPMTGSLSTSSSGILNDTLTLSQNDIDDDLTSSTFIYNRNNKTTLSVDIFKRPSSTTAKSTVVSDEDEANEFIEIKNK